jgi:hypothetical protein
MATNPLANLTIDQLKRAVAIKQQIDQLERALASLMGISGRSSVRYQGRGGKKRRTMSPAARAKIAAAARARWAKWRAGKK